MDTSQIIERWKCEEPSLKVLGEKIVLFLKDELYKKELHAEISFRTKEIQSIIKKIHRKSKEKNYTYDDLRDTLGIRIICPFLSDLNIVDELLRTFFIIKKVEKKKDNIDFNRLDYQSNHYDVSVKKEYIESSVDSNFIFEIQVRTMNQHAWANSAHILYYKQDVALPDELKHKIYRLLSLYELADDEFEKVNDYLKAYKDDLSYTLLRKLEGKIYKYALTDFDRDLSVEQMPIILNFFSKKDQEKINAEIESFILEYDLKIQHIYTDNRDRYAEISFLTQPEIFVILWGLTNCRFSITDNWCFDEKELESIQTLWCSL